MSSAPVGAVVAMAATVAVVAATVLTAAQLAPSDHPGSYLADVPPLVVASPTAEPEDPGVVADPGPTSPPVAATPPPEVDPSSPTSGSDGEVVSVAPPPAAEVDDETGSGKPESPGRSQENKPDHAGRPAR
jgi:hypothetical protein